MDITGTTVPNNGRQMGTKSATQFVAFLHILDDEENWTNQIHLDGTIGTNRKGDITEFGWGIHIGFQHLLQLEVIVTEIVAHLVTLLLSRGYFAFGHVPKNKPCFQKPAELFLEYCKGYHEWSKGVPVIPGDVGSVEPTNYRT